MQRIAIAGNTSTGILKLIALAAMVCDHVGAAIFPANMWYRVIGRIAFPLYCWCLVVGICHTRDMKRYFLRMLAAGIISQPLYMLALNHTWQQPNIMLTLALALGALWGVHKQWHGSQLWGPVLAAAAAELLHCDYGWKGVLLPVVMYLLRGNRLALAAGVTAFCAAWNPSGVYVGYLFGIPAFWPKQPDWWSAVMPFLRVQFFAVLSLPFMLIRFPRDFRMPAWLRYGLYPTHLAAIWLVRLLMR